MFGLKIKKRNKAFTLVELIIVITILAILATIAFLSFRSYTVNARDSDRLTTIAQLKKALDIFKVETGKYKLPGGNTLTGTINGEELTYVGVISDEIATLLRFGTPPKDPLTKNKYVYATSFDQKYYEVATITEQTAPNYKSKVGGNYNGLLKKGNTVYNLPSLIFTGTGNLLSTGAYFVVDNGGNLPYKPVAEVGNNSQSTSDTLLLLGSTSSTLTGVTITNWDTQASNLESQLGFPIDKIGNEYYGNEYKPKVIVAAANSCATTPTNAVTVVGTPGSPSQAWQTSNPSGACYYTCNSGYGSTGTGCVVASGCNSAISEITLSNGQIWSCLNVGATTVWDGSASFTCTSSTDCSNKPNWTGDFYQGGRIGTGFTNGQTTSPYNYGWEAQDDNKLGGTGTTNSAGTYASQNVSNQTLMRGNCPTGWHTPTSYEWKLACDSISGTSCVNNSTTVNAIRNYLKLPLAGIRVYNSGNYVVQGTEASYMTSTPTSYSAYSFWFNTSGINTSLSSYRAAGTQLRCIKN